MSCSTNGVGPDRPDDRPGEGGSPRGAQPPISQAHSEQFVAWPLARPDSCVHSSVITRSRLLLHSRKGRLRAAFDIETQPCIAGKRAYPVFPFPFAGAA